MTPMQHMLLGVGAKKKVYLDDVFSNYLWTGDGASTRTITNNLDMSGEGALVWIKNRESTQDHVLADTVRGATKKIHTNKTNAEFNSSNTVKSFTSTGFTVGTNNEVNQSNVDYTSWSFRKAKGFFDIITYTGTGTSTNADGHLDINHSLASVPGMVIVKSTSGTSNWWVYHRGLATNNSKAVFLQSPSAAASHSSYWNGTAPTASQFTVGEWLNTSGSTYVAYLFAGGESTAATARSVDFDGSNDFLSIADHADFDVGTNWTAECWFKADSLPGSYNGIMGQWPGNSNGNAWVLEYVGTDLRFYIADSSYKSLGAAPLGQWHHVAISKQGSTTRIFLNGTQVVADYDMGTYAKDGAFTIGGSIAGLGWFDGKISNVRIVKGTAVYTSSFRPPTEPLTNITNTVLLCCNSSSITGSTVTPGTIYAPDAPTASTDSPFDDSAAYIFGEEGNQSIIKCGTFSTTASSANVNVELGWEPQWVITKKIDGTSNWNIWDTMRGWTVPGVPDSFLEANDDAADYTPSDYGGPHSTGFHNNGVMGYSGEGIYIAIRRLDPLVQKPVETATSVFAMDTGNGSSTIPTYDSGFPVDFAFARRPTATDPWYTSARLMNGKLLESNTSAAQATSSNFIFDSNNGWAISHGSDYQSWMWKRHAGFDVVTDTSAEWVKHNLNKIPEMVIIKNRTATENWFVWHKDLNGGGSNSIGYWIYLNGTGAESNAGNVCPIGNTLPTATHFQSDPDGAVRNEDCIAFLFASTDVSKVGSYTGNGSSSGITVTTGFQPRFYIIKRVDGTGPWYVVDSLRGMSNSGDEKLLKLNSSDAQVSDNIGNTSSTGFTITSTHDTLNGNGDKYLYYAHA
jgi:hypothetical protein